MEINATIDLIIRDLEEAVKIIDDLRKYPGIPLLQVELAKAKCRSAADVIAFIKTMELNTSAATGTPVQKVTEHEQPVSAEKKKPTRTIKPERFAETLKTEASTGEKIPVLEIIDENPTANTQKEQVTKSVGDKFIKVSDSLNEKHTVSKGEDDVAKLLKSKPITSLTEAIGVNDRFLFIREIFDGKNDAYVQAIARLDKAESISDARAVIMSYTGDNKENEAVKQLIELFKRKLPSHE
jgi:hypothetical protein